MIYFVSDIHLGLFDRKTDKKRESLFLDFLDKASIDCETLFIVGDLFDYWFEYKTVIPKYYYRTLSAFSAMRDKGIKIEYLMGNHDFGHRTFFEEELDIPIYKTDIERELNGKKFFISHGDGKSDKDLGYKILKSILRNRFLQWLYNIIHPDISIKLASGSSKKSRAYTDKKDYGKNDGMVKYAESKLAEGFDFVVMGHRHKAEYTETPHGVYVNIGDWLKKPTFAIFDGEHMKLLQVDEFLKSES